MENYENSLVFQSRIETDTLEARATIFRDITTWQSVEWHY